MASWPYNTTAWKNLRASKLSASPCCEICRLRGQTVIANTVDHVKAIKAGGSPFPPLNGLMSLCQRCHNEKTASVDHPDRAAGGRRFKGFDVHGNPIDPGDAWHGGPVKDGKGKGPGPLGESFADIVSLSQRERGC